MIAQTRVGKDS